MGMGLFAATTKMSFPLDWSHEAGLNKEAASPLIGRESELGVAEPLSPWTCIFAPEESQIIRLVKEPLILEADHTWPKHEVE